jgi:predicted NUDIX family phosphoesterase
LKREVAEEVDVQTAYSEKVVGLINDDSNPVGKVHLGVLVMWELAEPRVIKKERSITSLEFLAVEELRKRRSKLETWSQIVINNAPF